MRFPIKITENFILEPTLHVMGVNAETSYVEIADGALDVRMGIWFHDRFPLDQIARIAPSTWPWWGGLGVKLAHHGVGIVGATEGVVNVQFRTEQKAHVVVALHVSQLWISVEDADGFMKALSEKTRVPISELAPFT